MHWLIRPLDVLFFRGGDPMNAGESTQPRGMFPPTPMVLQGFVRSVVLRALDVDYDDYKKAATANGGSPEAKRAVELIGKPGDDLGQLDIKGPFITVQRAGMQEFELLYPLPLDLSSKDGKSWVACNPGDEVECDLGSVRFLESVPAGRGSEELYVTEDGLRKYLSGSLVPADSVIPASDLFLFEQRVGIARDAITGGALDQHIFSPVFTRVQDGGGRFSLVGLSVFVEGIPDELQKQCAGVHKLGGEGRLAELRVLPSQTSILSEPVDGAGRKVRLVLVTPSKWGETWSPSSSSESWILELNGMKLNVVSACVGKSTRIGGWDIVAGQPKLAEPSINPGAVFFVEVDEQTASSLHDRKFGNSSAAGFGHVFVGTWS